MQRRAGDSGPDIKTNGIARKWVYWFKMFRISLCENMV